MKRSLKPLNWIAIFVFAFSLVIQAQSEEKDSLSIMALIDNYAKARGAEDPDFIRSLFVAEADQLVSTGEWRRGREVLVKGMLRSSRSNPGGRTITVERIRPISPEVAIADARYEIKGSNGRPDRKMWSTFIATRNGGQWQITAIRNMLPAQRN